MGDTGFFKGLEEELDKEYKESGLLVKFIQRCSPKLIAAGVVLAAIAAPFLGMFYSSAKRDYERQVRQEARQEVLEFKEKYENAGLEELRRERASLDTGWEYLNKRKEELDKKDSDLFVKQLELDSKERLLDFDTRHLESGKKWLESGEQRLKSKEDTLTSLLETREGIVDVREKLLAEAEKKLEGMLLNSIKNSLPFSQAIDLNGNYVLDPVDAEISSRFLGGMPVLSEEYVRAVRYIHSPAVIKKLERYGINTHVICVNETTLVVPKGTAIDQVIENVPPELLHDFVARPGGKKGIEEILCNRQASGCSHVFFTAPGKCCGSGFVLGDNYLATAYHVAECIEAGSHVQFEDGSKIELSKDSIVAYSEEQDIAVIKCDFKGYKPVVIQDALAPGSGIVLHRSKHSTNLEKGEKSAGMLRFIEQVSFDSPAIGPDEMPCIKGTDRYVASLQVYPGDSGSAVLNQAGELVGIAVGAYGGCKEAANIVRAKYLRMLLEFYDQKAGSSAKAQ